MSGKGKNEVVSRQSDGNGFLGLYRGLARRFPSRSQNRQCGLLLQPIGEGLSSLSIKKARFPHSRRAAASR